MNDETVDRTTFDDVMVPTYAPGDVIPVRGKGPGSGIRRGRSMLIWPGGLRLRRWGIRILR